MNNLNYASREASQRLEKEDGMKRLCLDDGQVRDLRDGKNVVKLVPIKRNASGRVERYCDGRRKQWHINDPEAVNGSPYRNGDLLFIGETYAVHKKDVPEYTNYHKGAFIFYRQEGDENPSIHHWKSPVTMPRWCARLFAKVISVSILNFYGKFVWRVEVVINEI